MVLNLHSFGACQPRITSLLLSSAWPTRLWHIGHHSQQLGLRMQICRRQAQPIGLPSSQERKRSTPHLASTSKTISESCRRPWKIASCLVVLVCSLPPTVIIARVEAYWRRLRCCRRTVFSYVHNVNVL